MLDSKPGLGATLVATSLFALLLIGCFIMPSPILTKIASQTYSGGTYKTDTTLVVGRRAQVVLYSADKNARCKERGEYDILNDTSLTVAFLIASRTVDGKEQYPIGEINGTSVSRENHTLTCESSSPMYMSDAFFITETTTAIGKILFGITLAACLVGLIKILVS